MGVVLSIISLLGGILGDFQAARKRASEPHFPVPNPTTPYWTRDPPHPDLVRRQSPALPRTAEVAVIGSGIAGAAVVRSLLMAGLEGDGAKEGPGAFGSVVVLEARDVCSGATARNGGHIKATPYEVYPRFAKSTGSPARAAALTRFQRRHLDVLLDLCRAAGIEAAAEAREVETVDLFVHAETFGTFQKWVEETRPHLPEEEMTVWPREEAQKKFGTGEAVQGAISYRAGAIWPYRFVTSIWHQLLAEFPDVLSLETHTPVTGIRTDDAGAPEGYPYALATSRGTVYARNVVHATNGYASGLVPGLRQKITPARAHMSAQQPGRLFPADHGAHRSWGVIYDRDGFDYVTQRRPDADGAPPSQGDLLLGGGFFRSPRKGVDMIGVSDDGASLDPLTLAHIAGIFPAVFSPHWGPGAELKQAWSGTLGFTGDLLPLVGKLDPGTTGRTPRITSEPGQEEKPCGEWLAAGFSGEGMVWAWLCGTALGVLMAGLENESLDAVPGRPAGRLDEWFPHEIWLSKARLRSADLVNLANEA